jgi:tetratricopeptide (TPR) repeat protein
LLFGLYFDSQDGSGLMKVESTDRFRLPVAPVLFLVALAIRIVYLFQIQSIPLTTHLSLDAASYDGWALDITRGNWVGDRVFYQAPLYPYFLAILYKGFGHHLNLVRLVQLVMGAMNCVFIYWMGVRLFGKREALWCGALALLYGILVFYEGAIGKDGLSIFLSDLALLGLLGAMDQPGWHRWILSGTALGSAILTRGNLILLIPCIMVWMLIVLKKESLGKRLVALATFTAGVTLVVFPVTMRNYIVGQDLVLETSQGGQNFYIGNNPRASGFFENPEGIRLTPEYEEEDFRAEALRRTGRKAMKPSEISGFWFREGLRFIRDNPQRAVRLLAKKTAMFWNRFEIPDNYNYYFFKQEAPVLRFLFLGFGIIAPLGLWGLLLARQRPAAWLLILFIFGYMASIVPFHLASRYRLPVIPPLILFAGYTLSRAIDLVRSRDYKPLMAAVIPVGLLTAAINWKVVDEAPTFKAPYTELGIIATQEGDDAKAMAYFSKALTLDPGYAPAHYNMGNAFAKQGRFQEAVSAYRKALENDPEFLMAYDNLAKSYIRLGNLEKALQVFRKALDLRPDFAEGLVGEGIAYHGMGRYDDAIDAYKKAVALKPELASGYYNLACAYGKKGEVKEARAALERAVALRPDYAQKACFDPDLEVLRKPDTGGL